MKQIFKVEIICKDLQTAQYYQGQCMNGNNNLDSDIISCSVFVKNIPEEGDDIILLTQ